MLTWLSLHKTRCLWTRPHGQSEWRKKWNLKWTTSHHDQIQRKKIGTLFLTNHDQHVEPISVHRNWNIGTKMEQKIGGWRMVMDLLFRHMSHDTCISSSHVLVFIPSCFDLLNLFWCLVNVALCLYLNINWTHLIICNKFYVSICNNICKILLCSFYC